MSVRGTTVSLAEARQTCRDILDGRYDDLPADAFYFSGDEATPDGRSSLVPSRGRRRHSEGAVGLTQGARAPSRSELCASSSAI
jgi:hypothetical protein